MPAEKELLLGALADNISVQLKKMKLPFDANKIKFCQRVADAISLLHVKGYIGDRASDTARAKLAREIKKNIKH